MNRVGLKNWAGKPVSEDHALIQQFIFFTGGGGGGGGGGGSGPSDIKSSDVF